MTVEPEILNPQPSIRNRLPRIISIWFFIQVVLNVAAAAYLTLNPPPEPATLFDKIDLTINTGVNLALGIGFWKLRPWAWPTAVMLVPLYWTLHLWHMVVPAEGLLLWPFLLIDALILAWLLNPAGRRVFSAPEGRFRRFSYLPPVMGALALYASLAPVLGLFVALAMGVAVVVVGWRKAISNLIRRR
jgi:hypothetical protein